jgi:hypothetical protein
LVGDRCIHVKSVEQTPQGTMAFDLGGRFVGFSTFQGEFRGRGPQGCESKGTFTVYADLDPIPASPAVNPAPPDAGTNQQALCDACRISCELVDSAYTEDCLQGCEHYVCNPGRPPDAGVADAVADVSADALLDTSEEATDALDDSSDDALSDAPQDMHVDALEDADGDTPGEGSTDAEPDASGDDAAPDAQADASSEAGEPGGASYVLWDGSVHLDDLDEAADKVSCSAAADRAALNPLGAGLLLAAMAVLARARRLRIR